MDLQLTELQHAVMRVLWDRGEATVAEVQERLLPQRTLAPTTVATLLKRLEKRGLLQHRTEGRHYVYRACVSEEEIRRSMLTELADRVFQGDVTALLSQLLDAREMKPGDLEKVKALIEAHEREHEDR